MALDCASVLTVPYKKGKVVEVCLQANTCIVLVRRCKTIAVGYEDTIGNKHPVPHNAFLKEYVFLINLY